MSKQSMERNFHNEHYFVITRLLLGISLGHGDRNADPVLGQVPVP